LKTVSAHEKSMNLDEERAKCETMDDLTGKSGLVQQLIGGMVERLLEKEMEVYLGYEKHSSAGDNSGNSWNGKSKKNIYSSYGSFIIEVPRDRQGEFKPRLIKKRQTRIGSFDDKIVSMYAKGMTTRDIQSHLEEIYGKGVSQSMISEIAGEVVATTQKWQARSLEKIYPIVFFDVIHYKAKKNGQVLMKSVHSCFGINLEGEKEMLGMWMRRSKGVKFWRQIFGELKDRGVNDIFIACMGGFKGLPEALQLVFPRAEVQVLSNAQDVPSAHM